MLNRTDVTIQGRWSFRDQPSREGGCGIDSHASAPGEERRRKMSDVTGDIPMDKRIDTLDTGLDYAHARITEESRRTNGNCRSITSLSEAKTRILERLEVLEARLTKRINGLTRWCPTCGDETSVTESLTGVFRCKCGSVWSLTKTGKKDDE